MRNAGSHIFRFQRGYVTFFVGEIFIVKSLNSRELDLICEELNNLKGAQFQELRYSGTCFEFGFWFRGQRLWWHLNLEARAPLWLPVAQPTLPKRSQNKPIYLFLKAHAVGRRLEAITRDEKLGRVLVVKLRGFDPVREADSICEMEVRLFPHGQNLIVRGDGKQLSLKPVKEMEALESLKVPDFCRSLNELVSEFEGMGSGGRLSKALSSEKLLARQVSQLERAIQKVSQDLENKKQLPWRQVGAHLVQTQGFEVPPQWDSYIDTTESLAWNIENCFARAKANVQKITGAEDRLTKLQGKLQNLKERGIKEFSLPSPVKKGVGVPVKVRKMNLAEGLEAWIGKSAHENIKLLRQAKPWDLWVHLADHPSCHVVIRRPRGHSVSHQSLLEVGKWAVRMTFGEKSQSCRGDYFEILYTECRYVSPIKGDRVGRVTYRNEKVIGFKF